MIDHAPIDFQYPSTRYSGSKRRFVEWIWEHVKELPFDSALDAFGGTASVSLLFKRYGKQVFYNDLLKFNQIIGTAVIENSTVKVTPEDLNTVLQFSPDGYPDFIQREFEGTFFLDTENAWLDRVVTNISKVENEYKQAILMASLFQACLAKRPFNLFHRVNLNIRTASVRRTFGNKTTWEHPFSDLFSRYAIEYNNAIFSNGQENGVVGGYDALSAPNGVDLVYLDPPYFSASASQGTNYLAFYHFL
jgi:adenine-specific DNA methylase